MALIICPECGKEISNKAKQCIHCGFPLEEISGNKDLLYHISVFNVADNASKVKAIKYVHEIANVNLETAKHIIDYPHSIIKSGISKDECNSIKENMESFGITVLIEEDNILSVKNHDIDTHMIICNILGEEFDLTNIYHQWQSGQYYTAFQALCSIGSKKFLKHNMKPINYLAHYLDEYGYFPNEVTQEILDKTPFQTNLELTKRWKAWQLNPKLKIAQEKGIVVCPQCGSSSVATTNRGFSIVTGFIGSGNPRNVCQNCGYKWKPKR